MRLMILVGLLLLVVLAVGCSKAQKAQDAATQIADKEVQTVDNDLTDMETLNDDLDTSELEEIDTLLDELDW